MRDVDVFHVCVLSARCLQPTHEPAKKLHSLVPAGPTASHLIGQYPTVCYSSLLTLPFKAFSGAVLHPLSFYFIHLAGHLDKENADAAMALLPPRKAWYESCVAHLCASLSLAVVTMSDHCEAEGGSLLL